VRRAFLASSTRLALTPRLSPPPRSRTARGGGLEHSKWPPRYDRRPSPHVRPCFLSSKRALICFVTVRYTSAVPFNAGFRSMDPESRASIPPNVHSHLRRLLPPVARSSPLHLRTQTSLVPAPAPAPARPPLVTLRRSPRSTPSTLSHPHDLRHPPILEFASPLPIFAAPHRTRPLATSPWRSARVAGRDLTCYLVVRDRPLVTLISETLAPASLEALFQITHRISCSRTMHPRARSYQRHIPALPSARAPHPPIRLPPALRLVRCTSHLRTQGHPRASPPSGPSISVSSALSARPDAYPPVHAPEYARTGVYEQGIPASGLRTGPCEPAYMRAMMADMRRGPTSATTVAMQRGALKRLAEGPAFDRAKENSPGF
jgi:hypothetical protein